MNFNILRRVFGRAFLALSVALLFGAHAPTSLDASGQSLKSQLDALMSKSKIGSKATYGATVIDLDSGKTIYTYQADQAVIPASNMKLLTTAAALCELGQDFKLRTELRAKGSVIASTLHGDLVLVGFGDPNISGRFHDGDITYVLRTFAEELKSQGIQRISGKLCFDDSYFSGDRYHADWPQDQYLKWYTAEVSALSLNDNCVTIQSKPSSSGHAAQVECLPANPMTTIRGSISTISGRADPVVGWTRERDSNDIKVWGKVAAGRGGYSGDCTVHDPARFFAATFQQVLKDAGIDVQGEAERHDFSASDLESMKLLASHSSDMATTLFVTNTNSQNLYAECLFRILGAEQNSEGSFAGGANAVRAFLGDATLPTQGLVVNDGSGLARSNRVTTRLVAELLESMAERDDFVIFKNSLAVSGSTGTLRKRLKSSNTKGRVFAKTGYIDKVGALSGYVDTKSGKRYAFSIILNDYSGSCRSKLDAFVEALAKN